MNLRRWMTGTGVVSLLAGVLLIPAAAAAQDRQFTGNLTGAQEVPPSGSAGFGSVAVTLQTDPLPTSSILILSAGFQGLSGTPIAAHIHGPAAPGSTGPIVFTLTVTGTTSGALTGTFDPTPTQLAELLGGLWYVNIHTPAFPDGEIRAQIRPEPALKAILSGDSVAPLVTTAAFGYAAAFPNALATRVWVTLRYFSLSGGHTGIHVHGPAITGTNGPIVATFAAPAATDGGVTHATFAVTPAQLAQLKGGLFYFDVHSAAHPDGEIRGQIKLAAKPLDYDGDSRAEVIVFRPSTGTWYGTNPTIGWIESLPFGASGDQPLSGDFDGDGRSDVVVWRPSTGYWYMFLSDGTDAFREQQFGAAGDIPTPGDFDGDGRTDIAVYRPGPGGTASYLYILQSSDNAVKIEAWGIGGAGGDTTVLGDFDGDRKNDVAVYRTGTGIFYVKRSTDGTMLAQPWGSSAIDTIAPSDYDGDSITDFAVFRHTGADAGTWYVLQSSTGTLSATPFGLPGDLAIPADYDGDGKTDVAVGRVTTGAWVWYAMRSGTGTLMGLTFGLSTDILVPRYLVR